MFLKFLPLVIFLTFGCSLAQTQTQQNYGSASEPVLGSDGFPNHWWAPVPESDVKDWEIPPQAANRDLGEVILSKRNELGDFSNLGPHGFTMDGENYESLEGLWQAMKYPEGPNDERFKDSSLKWDYTREQVKLLKGFAAKKAGDLANANMKKLGIKWVTYKGEKIEYNGSGIQRHYEIIFRASQEKIAQNADLKKLLISTKSLKFLPDHKQKPDSPPAYLYHQIYSKIRDQIQKQNN